MALTTGLIVLVAVVLLALCGVGEARNGVDLSVATTLSQWQCLTADHAVDYAIVRGYRNVGQVDLNSAASLTLAHEAGIADLGVYMFPCVTSSAYAMSKNITCPAAKDQVLDTIHFLEQNKVFIKRTHGERKEDEAKSATPAAVVLNRFWLDIEDESPSKYFDSNASVNQVLIADIISVLTDLHIPIGIYSTKTYWQNIMGNIEGYAQYPLWYPRYDNVNSMDFFSPFAGWTEPLIKQTAGDAAWCSISQVDTDYRLD